MTRLGHALAALFLVVAAPAAAQDAMPAANTPFRPVAVVNDRVITGFDLEQRARLLSVLGFPSASDEALRQAALQRLIDDRLKLEAGEDIGLHPSARVVEAGVEAMAEQLDTTPDELRVLVSNQNITEQALADFVMADVIWNEVIRTRFAGRIQPGDAEIDSEIAFAGGGGEVAYRLQELGLPATGDGRSEAETRDLAERLYNELSAGGDFGAAVERYSRAPSASSRGEVGWVPARSLPADVADAVARVGVGGVTRPLPVPGGFSILRVADRQLRGGEALDPDDPELRARIREHIIQQQSARLAEGLLQELRRDAIIELR